MTNVNLFQVCDFVKFTKNFAVVHDVFYRQASMPFTESTNA